jgi:hypothetical protein
MKASYFIKSLCLLVLSSLWMACEKEETMTGIAVDKESLSLLLGDNAQITVQPIPAGIDVDTRTYEWSSDNEAVATVTPFGIVRTVEEGTCNITVKKGSFSQTIPVTVIDLIQVPDKKGQWKFDDAANLTAATIGNRLDFAKGAGNSWECPTQDVSGFEAIAGPNGDNKAVRVKKEYSFRVTHGLSAPAGYPVVPEYTLMFDFRIPETGKWYAFFQTDPANADGDAEVFIRPAGTIGVGTTGYSQAVVTPNVWHRFVVSGKYGEWYNYYLDGEPIHKASTDEQRFGLDLTYLLLFADNDGDDADIDVAEVALWIEPLDDAQVKKLERTESKIR